MPESAEAITNTYVTDFEVARIQSAFRTFGIDAEVRAGLFHKSVDEVPWQIILTLPPTILVGSFVKSVGSEAGKDFYLWLKTVAAARPGRSCTVNIRDEEHTNVTLHSGLTVEAVAQLDSIDWNELRGAMLFWDDEANRWIAPDHLRPNL